MPSSKLSPSRQSNRSKKPHTKSRLGCTSCKLRKVRCDQTKPRCEGCVKNGLVCDYSCNETTLRSAHEVIFASNSLSSYRCSDNRAVMNTINEAVRLNTRGRVAVPKAFRLDLLDMERLSRFQNRTLMSSGPSSVMTSFLDESLQGMTAHPCLLHVALTLTMMHDRHLSSQSYDPRTPLECYHWNRALQLFNSDLTTKLQTCDRNAMWMTGTMMSWITLFAVDTENIEQVWPLKAYAHTDLDWLEMQTGLLALWDTLNLCKGYSGFGKQTSSPGMRCLRLPPPKPGIEGIPLAIVDLCGLNQNLNAVNNPYHAAARLLSELLDESDSFGQSLRFLAFPNTLTKSFIGLLRARDPRALVLLGLWYESVQQSMWWMHPRASLESKAIWTYLERFYAHDALITPFLATYGQKSSDPVGITWDPATNDASRFPGR